MKRELTIFLTAVMFYTRIPCPKWIDHDPTYISLATRYIPLIGWIIGSIYAMAIVLLSQIVPVSLSVMLALCISILLTGAFHEDGFADVCDGFGGGWSKEKILLIMKDSRIGTYGVVGVLMILGIKVLATYELSTNTVDVINLFLIIVSSHTLSRMMAVVVIRFQKYAREEGDASKAKPVASGINGPSFVIALLIAVLPLFLLVIRTQVLWISALVPMFAMTIYLMRYFKRWIGGYTGDCLGAVQQVNEVVFLLGSVVIWKFI
ncbi:MAG: adenosylcobinamide-GDP ribazoletransferase [Cyclobacteriaceae bacterium]